MFKSDIVSIVSEAINAQVIFAEKPQIKKKLNVEISFILDQEKKTIGLKRSFLVHFSVLRVKVHGIVQEEQMLRTKQF